MSSHDIKVSEIFLISIADTFFFFFFFNFARHYAYECCHSNDAAWLWSLTWVLASFSFLYSDWEQKVQAERLTSSAFPLPSSSGMIYFCSQIICDFSKYVYISLSLNPYKSTLSSYHCRDYGLHFIMGKIQNQQLVCSILRTGSRFSSF